MLRTKSIYDKIEPADGLRISVMSAHLRREEGKWVPDPELDKRYDEHLMDLAPPRKLVGKWYKSKEEGADMEQVWETDFAPNYLAHLNKPIVFRRSFDLAQLAVREEAVTIMCVEPVGKHCHRLLLAKFLQTLEPGLQVRHV